MQDPKNVVNNFRFMSTSLVTDNLKIAVEQNRIKQYEINQYTHFS